MDSAKLNDWLQVIGLFGVIASLIFVGLQMKQDREIALSETYQNRTATGVEILIGFNANAEFLDLMSMLQQGDARNLSFREQSILENMLRQGMNIYENAHYQYTHGFVDDEYWRRTENQIRKFLLTPIFIPYIKSDIENGLWRESFGEYMLGLIGEVSERSGTAIDPE